MPDPAQPGLPLGPTPPQVAAGLHVALSGGLDSMALLHALATDPVLRGGLRALHVDHGLHPSAPAWAATCTEACARLGVPLTVVRVDVARHAGQGIEAAARAARLEAFARAIGGGVIALAQHQRDQAETFLLRALRASGVDGLAAMSPLRAHADGWLWRPLLAVPRDALHAYAVAHGLPWVDDPSNQDEALDRNFLRLRVLPLLRTRWPGSDAAFARAATLAGEASTLLEAGDDALLASALDADGALAIEPLRAWPAARTARVLRRWVALRGLPPLPAEGVRRLPDLLSHVTSPAIATFEWSGAAVSRWRRHLHGYRVRPPLPADYRAGWSGGEPLRLPGGGWLCLQAIPAATSSGIEMQSPAAGRTFAGVAAEDAGPPSGWGPFVVRARHGGERIRLPGRRHRHALKHVLQDAGVPPWLRTRMPLLCAADGRLLAAGDRILADGVEAGLRTLGLRLAWLHEDDEPVAGHVSPG
ncbi:MAG TPA: tRNA lysidine(34) synthetase TilS [Luteimonas sp.]|nr:tRNA lysidine(34) synthetase TilS [Luteimonas sp.]